MRQHNYCSNCGTRFRELEPVKWWWRSCTDLDPENNALDKKIVDLMDELTEIVNENSKKKSRGRK